MGRTGGKVIPFLPILLFLPSLPFPPFLPSNGHHIKLFMMELRVRFDCHVLAD